MICCGDNTDEACGWPKNTVRAFIAIFTTVLVLSMGILLIIFLIQKDQINAAIGVGGIYSSLLSGIIGYYFGNKSGSDVTAGIERNNQLQERIQERFARSNQENYDRSQHKLYNTFQNVVNNLINKNNNTNNMNNEQDEQNSQNIILSGESTNSWGPEIV